jgi:type II secretory pathway component GspD/PulD (secretin)
MGGINIDVEGSTVNRTPGVSRIPVVGHLFKRKTTRRNSDEILFFLTPRIVRSDGIVGPRTQRSSVEGQPKQAAPERAAAQSLPAEAKADAKGKGGQ